MSRTLENKGMNAGSLTDLDIVGVSLIVWVWKLNGFRAAPGGGGGPIMASLLSAGLALLAGEGIVEFMDPKRLEKTSNVGDKALRSMVMVEFMLLETPSIPRPLSFSSGIGVGGLGVRGGAGIGRLEAIIIFYMLRGIMRSFADLSTVSLAMVDARKMLSLFLTFSKRRRIGTAGERVDALAAGKQWILPQARAGGKAVQTAIFWGNSQSKQHTIHLSTLSLLYHWFRCKMA